MKKNLGKTDRLIRIGLGVLLFAVGMLFTSGWVSFVLLIGAGLLFVTAALGSSVLYLPFKIDTSQKA